MINKLSEDWGRIEEAARNGAPADTEEWKRIQKSMVAIRDALRRMCEVHVTRTTLKEAVKEALLDVIKEHGKEIFPEALGQASRVDLETLTREVRESVQTLQNRLENADERHSASLGSLREKLEEQIRSGLLIVEERVEKAREHFKGLLSKLEESVPEKVDQKTGELEARLRKEIDEMVENLTQKLSELQTMLGHLEEILPRREALDAVDARLGRIEGKVENIDSVTPELKSLDARLGALKEQLSSVLSGIGATDRGVGRLEDSLTASLSELRKVLEGGIERWESDQSRMLERLGGIRDTLRDQLRAVADRVSDSGKGVWSKITRKDGGLKLTREEWDQLAGKIEGILAGLEAVLAGRK
jgi:hypothetical protein